MPKQLSRFLIFSAILVASFSCSKDSSEVLPDVMIDKRVYSGFEDATDGFAYIPVILSGTSSQTVSIIYETMDSTAVAGSDYVAAYDTLEIAPGAASGKIRIGLIRNAANIQDSYFKVVVHGAIHANFTALELVVKLINVDYETLSWSDEFNDTVLNTLDWNYEYGNNGGWGNQELESYTDLPANVGTADGYLYIHAIETAANTYTSARLTTKDKRSFTYGKVEIRALIPEGQGIWPALWMLGSNISTVGWPACGEIDIMELVGHEPSTVYGTLHYNLNGHQQAGNGFTLASGKFSDDYHIFTLNWQPNRLTWFVDGQQFCSLTRNAAAGFPMDLPEFFIFNVAVGGLWPGYPDESTVFPQTMKVDYIRVYH